MTYIYIYEQEYIHKGSLTYIQISTLHYTYTTITHTYLLHLLLHLREDLLLLLFHLLPQFLQTTFSLTGLCCQTLLQNIAIISPTFQRNMRFISPTLHLHPEVMQYE